MSFLVRWNSAHRKAKVASNPDYPDGKDCVIPGEPSCTTPIPYPAPECGQWILSCDECGITVAVTAAGRPDDPRSLTVPCKRKLS